MDWFLYNRDLRHERVKRIKLLHASLWYLMGKGITNPSFQGQNSRVSPGLTQP